MSVIMDHLREFFIRNCTVWPIFIRMNVFFALKGSNLFILIHLIFVCLLYLLKVCDVLTNNEQLETSRKCLFRV